jgi:crotonobetainyl-CoA:carnitine CoA-transferase CaiB-like acyl-CoA transferase
LARKPIKRPRDRHAAGKADELSRRMITGSPRRLVDESPGQETTLAASEEFDNRRKALADALSTAMQPLAVEVEGAAKSLRFPPKYGGDTRRVLAQAGYADAEIDALAEQGVVA